MKNRKCFIPKLMLGVFVCLDCFYSQVYAERIADDITLVESSLYIDGDGSSTTFFSISPKNNGFDISTCGFDALGGCNFSPLTFKASKFEFSEGNLIANKDVRAGTYLEVGDEIRLGAGNVGYDAFSSMTPHLSMKFMEDASDNLFLSLSTNSYGGARPIKMTASKFSFGFGNTSDYGTGINIESKRGGNHAFSFPTISSQEGMIIRSEQTVLSGVVYMDSTVLLKQNMIMQEGLTIGNFGRTMEPGIVPYSFSSTDPLLKINPTAKGDAQQFTISAMNGDNTLFPIEMKGEKLIFNCDPSNSIFYIKKGATATSTQSGSYEVHSESSAGNLQGLDFYGNQFTFYGGNMMVNGTITCKGRMKVAEIETDKIRTQDIVADDITVKMENAADYVFDESYEMKTLDEVEAYVKSNKHLPGVPSAAEMSENGMSVSEMSNLLLEKVEELTLYMIQMRKEMNSLKEENSSLKAENRALRGE